MTFTKEQIEQLNQPIDLKNVAERKTGWDQKVPLLKVGKLLMKLTEFLDLMAGHLKQYSLTVFRVMISV